jgi:hypothetical protein
VSLAVGALSASGDQHLTIQRYFWTSFHAAPWRERRKKLRHALCPDY